MQPVEIFGVVAAVLVGAGIIVAAINYTSGYAEREEQQSRYCLQMLETFAARHSLVFEPNRMAAEGRFHDIGVYVNAAYDQLEPGIPAMVTMSALAIETADVLIQAAPSKWSLSEWIASERVEVGDLEFDTAFKVWIDGAAPYSTVLTPEVRGRLLELSPDEFLYNHGVMELRWEENCTGPLDDSVARLELAAATLRIVGTLGSLDNEPRRS